MIPHAHELYFQSCSWPGVEPKIDERSTNQNNTLLMLSINKMVIANIDRTRRPKNPAENRFIHSLESL